MGGLKTGPATRGLQVFAIPGVCILISFLGYFSQWLFYTSPDLAPGPLSTRQTYLLNGLLACLWWTYYKACTVNPGRYTPPPSASESGPEPKAGTSAAAAHWCKKCSAPKPLRAHHCRHCGRCIPKMDHHCPWTGNCVSMQTFPYFLRFLLYTNAALWTLGYFVFERLASIWAARNLPAYLGPTLPHLTAITLISLVCAGTSIALGVLLFTTLRGCVLNSTMIEDWELERHEAVLTRLNDDDTPDDFWGADGRSGLLLQHLDKIEFPYDLGFFANVAQAMGTRNPLLWVFPFAGGPVINNATLGKGPGWEWEENGFNDLPGLWPPPDPEKLRRAQAGWPGAAARVATEGMSYADPRRNETQEERKAAFARRQAVDIQRKREMAYAQGQRSGIIAELEEMDDVDGVHYGGPIWTNSEGDSLWDYGVDEEVEIDTEQERLIPIDEEDDDVPLGELLRRRRVLTREEDR